MCEPVTATTYAMMALSGGQAVLGNKAQTDAASARNRNKKRLYDNDVSRIIQEHNQNISLYYLRGVDAEHAWDDAAIEANRNANQQQVILNEGIAQALQATQDDYVKLAGDVSVAKSLEKSGVSARRARVSARAKLGRARAARSAQQDIARDKAALVFAEIQRIKQSKIREADRMIGLEPERAAPPPEPVWDKGPSMFQQLMNVGMAVGSAYLMGSKTGTKAPKGPGYEITGGASVESKLYPGTYHSPLDPTKTGHIPTGAHGWGFSSSGVPYSGAWANLPGGAPFPGMASQVNIRNFKAAGFDSIEEWRQSVYDRSLPGNRHLIPPQPVVPEAVNPWRARLQSGQDWVTGPAKDWLTGPAWNWTKETAANQFDLFINQIIDREELNK